MVGTVEVGPGVGVRYKIDKVLILTRKSANNFYNNYALFL